MNQAAGCSQTGTENLSFLNGEVDHNQAQNVEEEKKRRRDPAEDCIKKKGNYDSDSDPYEISHPD
jgi:hypothetical protein